MYARHGKEHPVSSLNTCNNYKSNVNCNTLNYNYNYAGKAVIYVL